ncbi:ribosomal protein S18-alanine N-acetyltransferase [Oleispirillum naphthae]|uniref:ribosomal protein S18-alanine N-acetyltransferase n=1 Tax=Oleispirillum naphthae TaxID=2838853 RepID=UPI0030822613
MHLIDATPVYAPVLARLHAAMFHRPWSEGEFRTLLSSAGVLALLAESEEAGPVGFVLTRIAADEMEILTIGVRPEQRGEGVGHLLLKHALAAAAEAGAAQAFLEVSVNNHAAVALYTAHEFQITGTRRKYYLEFINNTEKRVDAHIMAKGLTGLGKTQ